jgi:hypothetical protein
MDSLENLEADHFLKHLNQSFSLYDESGAQVETKLSEVTVLGSDKPRSERGKRQPFSIVFSGPLEPILPQGIYRVKHEQLEQLNVFLVPIGPNKEGMRYEAVFS